LIEEKLMSFSRLFPVIHVVGLVVGLVAGLVLGVTSCTVTRQVGLHLPGDGSGSSGSSGSQKITMIDVSGKSPAEAEAALRAAGITGSMDVRDNYVCDVPGIEELHVCYTSPRAGQASSTTLPVTLYLRHKETRSFAMPDLRGKTVDEAKQILIGMGQPADRFIVEEARGAGDCQPSRICRQSPEPGKEHWVSLSAWLWFAPASATPRTTAETRPSDPRSQPEAKKPETKPGKDEPKPIF
jgi:beta-lactam-binding protein with PASTA domain